ncbi:sensor histidine kinase [Methanobacterium sp.]|uniref:sensor histidine kinase n=1 Tax=Methanobacterium sp. TaxID=2164 RepID=UPI003C74CE66
MKLEESRRKYFDLYNFVSDGYFTLNKEGIILEANLAAATLLGIERRKLINSTFIKYIDPSDRNKFHHHCMEVMQTSIKHTVEIKLLKNDNSSFYVHMDTLNILDDDNNFKEFRISITDITEIKTAAKEIESANKYNRSLIEASLDPLVTIGPDGKITDVNQSTEKVTGFSRNELIGTDFSNYFTEPKQARKSYLQVFKVGFVFGYPLEIKNKNGNVTPVLYNASVYKDEFGEVLGVFAAARDITETRKAENILKDYQNTLEEKVKIRTEELAKSNADLTHFAYIASHDLREPLRMITSFLQLLERRYADKLDHDANEFINFAVEGAKRLDNMINDLLEYSKITNKEKEFVPLKLENVLEEALMNLVVQIEESDAVITYDPLPTVNGDEKLLVMLFQNIIANAIKYRRNETPKIHISSIKENDHYVISINDNGIGIDQKYLTRIFTIFQRLHRNDEYDGTGIGLAIVENIVHQHGGEIWVESELGKGSTFYFTISNKKNEYTKYF